MERYRRPTSILWPTGHYIEFDSHSSDEAIEVYQSSFPPGKDQTSPPQLQVLLAVPIIIDDVPMANQIWQWVNQ